MAAGGQAAGRPGRPRPTARGWLVGATSIICTVAGLVSADAVLIQVGLFPAMLWILSFFLAYWNVRGVTVEHEHPSTAFVGETIDLKVRINCRRGASYALEIADELWNSSGFARAVKPHEPWPFAEVLSVIEVYAGQPALAAPAVVPKGTPGDADQLVRRCRKRGIFESFSCCVSSEFPFGLFRCSMQLQIDETLTVYPQPTPIRELDHWLILGGGGAPGAMAPRRQAAGEEFHGIREFAHGDALRLVHWPLSARHDMLVVREFESSELRDTLLVFHSCQPAGKRLDAGEAALSVFTGIALELYERGLPVLVQASFNDWKRLERNQQTGSLECLLNSFAAARITPTADFQPLLQVVEAAPDNQRLIVVGSTPLEHWADALQPRPNLICLDHSLRPRLSAQALETAV